MILLSAITKAAKSTFDACKQLVTGSKRKRRQPKKPPVGNLTALADGIEVDPAIGTGMSVRAPGTTSHVENEFGEYAEEQFDKHEADGIQESRPAHEEAAGVDFRASQAEERVSDNKRRLEQAQADHDHAVHWLLPFTRRPVSGHRLYLLWFALLMLGDAAGVFGAAVMWGELIPVAIGQALASGAAAVAAGWVGADVRERRDAETRARMAASDELPDDLVGRYPALFVDTVRERYTYELTLWIAVVIVICLASAIFALRAAVEASLLAGFVFGGLAAATALGSFVNSWRHADLVSDLLERVELTYANAIGEHERLVANPAPGQRDAALTRAGRIEAHHLKLAAAAKHGVLALLHGVLRRNPQVFGHGVVDEDSVPVRIGRKYVEPELPAADSPKRSADVRETSPCQNGFRPLVRIDGHHLE